jgi:hypothetical protein
VSRGKVMPLKIDLSDVTINVKIIHTFGFFVMILADFSSDNEALDFCCTSTFSAPQFRRQTCVLASCGDTRVPFKLKHRHISKTRLILGPVVFHNVYFSNNEPFIKSLEIVRNSIVRLQRTHGASNELQFRPFCPFDGGQSH